MKPKLTVAAVPIDGDWRSLDPRLIRAIRGADLLVAEEKKNALRLLAAADCKDKEFILLNEHTTDAERADIVDRVMNTAHTVFVSDAGTPCLADPDYRFVDTCIKRGAEIRSVPGASSVAAALSVSGFPADRFIFMGFPPRDKAKRRQFFSEISVSGYTVVFLERPYALRQTLSDMQTVKKPMCLCLGLGTESERIIRGSPAEIAAQTDGVKQVFAVVVTPSK